MNEEETFKKGFKENPIKTCGFISRNTFWWLWRTFATGYKRVLKENDLFSCLDEETSESVQATMRALWREEKIRREPSILRVFWRAYGPAIVFWGLFCAVIDTLCRSAIPQFLGQILTYFKSDVEVSLNDAYMYGVGIVIFSIIPIFTVQYQVFWLAQISLRLKVGSSCLIYEKILSLRKSAKVSEMSGKAINLMTNDVAKIDAALRFFPNFCRGPLQSVVLGYFIYQELGVAAYAGLALMLFFLLVQSFIARKTGKYRLQAAGHTDRRVNFMNEILEGIQVIKMYTWEKSFAEVIEKIRRDEMKSIQDGYRIRAALFSFLMVYRISLLLSIISYFLMGYTITARKVFVCAAYFTILNESMIRVFIVSVVNLIEGFTTAQRILEFLLYDKQKMIKGDKYRKRFHNATATTKKICMARVTALWVTTEAGIRSISLDVKDGLCVVVGSVGSGKSSLLLALLGELELDSGLINVDGKISYFSQETWLFDGSIRRNILFVEDFDEKRYRTVLRVCALGRDLELLPHGDKTIVGERGVRLSGGQKARVALARTIYRRADIYLLDDPLSALDAQVGRHIFENCIREFLAEKIVILVTHQLQYLTNVKQVIVMSDGSVVAEGSLKEIQKLSILTVIPDEIPHKEHHESSSTEQFKETEAPEAIDEHAEIGTVSVRIYKRYFQAVESKLLLCFTVIINLAVYFGFAVVDYILTKWVNWEESTAKGILPIVAQNVKYETRTHYAVVYTTLVVFFGICMVIRTFSFFSVTKRISRNLHDKMFRAISRTTMYFFNTNSSGRILNKFSKDIGTIDSVFPLALFELIGLYLDTSVSLILVIIMNYWMIIPTLLFLSVVILLGKIYTSTSRSVRRLESISRSPLLAHTNLTINGLTTIRAFNASDKVQEEFAKFQDINSSLVFLFNCTSRAFAIWLDSFCVLYILCVIYSFLLINTSSWTGGSVGLAITQSLRITRMLQYIMRHSVELENHMISMERVEEYIELPPEPTPDTPINPSPEWPERGRILLKNASLRYSKDSEQVLRNLSFTIEPREKIGIVGRTGAGKSSIVQVLFRLACVEGLVEIDGIDTAKLDLETLRSKISIIPQDPVLFPGTLRSNLDPFNEYLDADIWSALEQVELKGAAKSEGLESIVTSSGSNFSMGQRQLLCLARAILRNNKILILDEATANVDPETDRIIQKTIQTRFRDFTVLTIAHRLHTVMDSDKILVMNAGEVAEFGEPRELLKQENGVLRQLVDRGGSASDLKAIAEEHGKNKNK